MKKIFWGIIFFVTMFIVGCVGGAKPSVIQVENSMANSAGMTLDQALKEAAERIDERITEGSKIAPLNFNSPHDKFSSYVLDELTANLVDSRKLTVVDRKEVDLIRGEFDFQFSGEVGDDSMQELGRMLGAQAIISGSLTDLGGLYRIVIRVLNVQNASVEVQYRANIEDNRLMAALLTGGRTQIAVNTTPQRTSSTQTPTTQIPSAQAKPVPTVQVPAQAMVEPAAPPAPTTYNIGDKGPAGGWIFHDKGVFTNGWRYLEAAPNDVGPTQWGPLRYIGGLSTAIGTGRANTQRIVPILSQNNDDGAALLSTSLNINGYTDWFLPSSDELNFMYVNLHRRGLGSFSSRRYWSSSPGSDGSGNGILAQNFADGSSERQGARGNEPYFVRAIRQF